MSARDNAALWNIAERAADAARSVIRPHFRNRFLTDDNKDASGYDPVTAADREAEQAIREIIQSQRPEDSILGEEFGHSAGTSGLTWIIDPIDGTRAFVSGTPTWGVLIALADETGPILGVIDQPYISERFRGGLGVADVTGPFGTHPLGVRATTALSDAIVFTTFPEVGTDIEGRAFHSLASQCKLTRYGCDCYAYGLLAAGSIDLVMEAQLNSYDIAAPIAVIEAAGGIVTDWSGGPAHHGGQVLAAANRTLHAQALASIQHFLENDRALT